VTRTANRLSSHLSPPSWQHGSYPRSHRIAQLPSLQSLTLSPMPGKLLTGLRSPSRRKLCKVARNTHKPPTPPLFRPVASRECESLVKPGIKMRYHAANVAQVRTFLFRLEIKSRDFFESATKKTAPLLLLIYWVCFIVSLPVCIYWMVYLPPAGVAIGASGAAGVLPSEVKKHEKATDSSGLLSHSSCWWWKLRPSTMIAPASSWRTFTI
jgi:hypothetical protein